MKQSLQYGAARFGPEDVYNLPEDPVVMRSSKARAWVMFAIYMLAVLFICTELLAAHLHFDPALGKPEAGKIYDPWLCLYWVYHFGTMQYRSSTYASFMLSSLGFTALLIAAGFIASIKIAQKNFRHFVETSPRPPDLRGSAHWATPDELRQMGLLPADETPRTSNK